MNLQHHRIQDLCETLRLTALASHWPGLAQEAVTNETSYGEFLEQALQAELTARRERTRQTLQKLATLPAIKTLEQFDFSFASGVSKPQVQVHGWPRSLGISGSIPTSSTAGGVSRRHMAPRRSWVRGRPATRS